MSVLQGWQKENSTSYGEGLFPQTTMKPLLSMTTNSTQIDGAPPAPSSTMKTYVSGGIFVVVILLLTILALCGMVFVRSIGSTPKEEQEDARKLAQRRRVIQKHLHVYKWTKDNTHTDLENGDQEIHTLESGTTSTPTGHIKDHSPTTTTHVPPTTSFHQTECPICLENFHPHEVVCEANSPGSCPHVFHAKCITLWLMKHFDCPVCRQGFMLELQQKMK